MKKRQEADAAAALAQDKVLCAVPSVFKLNMGEKEGIITYPAGSYAMPRAHAEHSYSQAHGVRILGLPTEEQSA